MAPQPLQLRHPCVTTENLHHTSSNVGKAKLTSEGAYQYLGEIVSMYITLAVNSHPCWPTNCLMQEMLCFCSSYHMS